MTKPALLVALACFAIAACGSGKSSLDGAAGASGSAGAGGAAGVGGTGGGAGAGGNPACASAIATQACTAEGTYCGGELCTNECQFCNIVHCMNGVWQRIEVAPYPCFACGPDLQCRAYLDYCSVTRGGPPPGSTTYHCGAVPTACTSGPTCACLQSQGALAAGAACEQVAVGQLTVTLDVP